MVLVTVDQTQSRCLPSPLRLFPAPWSRLWRPLCKASAQPASRLVWCAPVPACSLFPEFPHAAPCLPLASFSLFPQSPNSLVFPGKPSRVWGSPSPRPFSLLVPLQICCKYFPGRGADWISTLEVGGVLCGFLLLFPGGTTHPHCAICRRRAQ